MKWLALEIILSLLFGIMVLAAAYHQRGYWAVGAEVVLPVILLMVFVKTKKKERKKL